MKLAKNDSLRIKESTKEIARWLLNYNIPNSPWSLKLLMVKQPLQTAAFLELSFTGLTLAPLPHLIFTIPRGRILPILIW